MDHYSLTVEDMAFIRRTRAACGLSVGLKTDDKDDFIKSFVGSAHEHISIPSEQKRSTAVAA